MLEAQGWKKYPKNRVKLMSPTLKWQNQALAAAHDNNSNYSSQPTACGGG